MKPDINQIQNVPDAATFTIAETARLLGVTRQAVLYRIKSGKLEATQVCSNWYVTGKAIKIQLRVKAT